MVLLSLCLLVPLGTAVLSFLARGKPELQRGLSVAGAATLLAVSLVLGAEVVQGGPIAATMGGWPAPFGITLVADLLSAAMVVITGVIALAVAVYGLGEVDPAEEGVGHHTLLHALLLGVTGAFLTGDLFNLYVWFEVMLIASFGLLTLGGRRDQLDGGVKYVTLNLVSTLAFLAGVGLLYGATGTLNMADLHGAVRALDNQTVVFTTAALMLFAFAVKSALFPLFFWLPASYHTPSVTVSAVFSALLTKVGVYALIRVFTLIYDAGMPMIQELLLVTAGLTMLTGVLGAAAQNEIRRILSFHIVSQIGYMVLGLALYTPLAIVGAIFYIIHHIVVKANLFLVGGVVKRLTGSEDLARIGGLWAAAPWLGVLFLIPALSLAGVPPLSGFWAKLVVIKASLEAEHYILAATALVVGLLTLYSMSKIWLEAFWKPHPEPALVPARQLDRGESWALLSPIIGLAAITLLIGLVAAPFYGVSVIAAEQLLDPEAYLTAVLGARP
ncbi:MAG: Na+/H+ antiporter subunit D [Alphaproteobacteria bacterium]